MVIKTRSRNVMHKITATYGLKFNTMSDAKKAKIQISKNKKAQITPIKKNGKFYTFAFKFVFMTPDSKVKERAVKEIKEKSPSARITTSTVKV